MFDCVKKNYKKKGYWKMNDSMLKEIAYVNMIREVINNTAQMFYSVCDPQVLWDVCKCQIKNQSISYGKKTRKIGKTSFYYSRIN